MGHLLAAKGVCNTSAVLLLTLRKINLPSTLTCQFLLSFFSAQGRVGLTVILRCTIFRASLSYVKCSSQSS